MIFHTEAGAEHTDKPPLVLLHGFCEDQRMWQQWRKPLAKDRRVLCPDLPGCGQSKSLDEGFSLNDVGAALLDWLDKTVDEAVAIVGHSLGGYVMLAMLEQAPERFTGLGMFHSTAYADSEEKRQSRNNVIAFVEKYGVEKFAESFVPQLFRAENRERLEAEITHAVKLASQTTAETLIGYTRAMQQRPNRLPVLEACSQPILYLIGRHDTSVPLEDSKWQLHGLKNYEAHILEESGHVGMYEQAEESQRLLASFLQKLT